MNADGKKRFCFAAGAGAVSAVTGAAISYSSGIEAAAASAGLISLLSAGGVFLRLGRQREYWPNLDGQEPDPAVNVPPVFHPPIADAEVAAQVERWLQFSARESAQRHR